MPKRQTAYQCSPLVKEAFNTIHASCGKKQHRQKGSNKTGLLLNKYSPVVQFEEEEWYHVCHNMDTDFKRKQITECISCFEKPVPLPPELVLPVVETREEGYLYQI